MTTPGTKSPHPMIHPYWGILGVFLGAGIATLNARLLSVGLPDLRGALGLGVDEAAWLPTALNMATMFSGVFVVFLAAFFGIRAILLPACTIFGIASALLPLARGYVPMLALIVIAGVTSGTFYSLTMTYVLTTLPKRLVIWGIAAYAAEIVFISNIASAQEGWYIDRLSWHWIFWTSAIVAPLMMLCIYFGIPPKPRSDTPPPKLQWNGFAFFSAGASLIYGALDQGERLDWLNSGTIIGMLVAGVLLLLAAAVQRLIQPHPIVDLTFLRQRNVIILALSVFAFRFVHLATVVLIPGFLSNIQQYRPLEVGHATAWVAVPMLGTVWLAAILIVHINSRLILASGLTCVAVSCWFCARVDTSWAGFSFETLELVIALGFACSYVGLVGCLVIEALDSGALTRPANAATYSGFVHFIRLFGGQVGVAMMTHFLSSREKFHSNVTGLHVDAGSWMTVDRLRLLTGGVLSQSSGPEEAQFRAVGLLGQQVRAQAFTMATADAFILISWMVVGYLCLMLFLRPGKVSFSDLSKMR